MEEAAIVDKAKRTHKETTQSAARAAKVSYPRLWMSTCYLTQGFTVVTDTCFTHVDGGADQRDRCKHS